MTPISYGKERCEQRPGNRAAGDAAFAQWVSFYREKGVEAVHGGLVMLRRRTGKNWVRLEEDAGFTLARPVGDRMLEGFAVRDLLQLTDEELLSLRPRLVDRAQLRQILRREGSKWTHNRLTLTSAGGSGFDQELSPVVAEFVGKFDGTRTLAELISDLARIAEADPEKVTAECLEITRHLLERGFVGNTIE